MSLHENINKYIKARGLTRKEFALKLIDLRPTLNRIGEVPSLSAIYTYLNGSASIKAELIPYIAEVLNIMEQELFNTNKKTRKKCFKYLVENAEQSELEYFSTYLNSRLTSNIDIESEAVMNFKSFNSNKIKVLINLLEYAPDSFIDRVISRLKEYKKIFDSF